MLSQLLARKPILDILEDRDHPNAMKRALGAGDLVMLAIGAVIGAGIFSSIGTAAAGEILPSGVVVRYGAGPAATRPVFWGALSRKWCLTRYQRSRSRPQAGQRFR